MDELTMGMALGQGRVTAPSQLLRPARSQRFPKDPAAGGAEKCRQTTSLHVPTRSFWPACGPVGTTAGGAASYSAVQLRRGPRTARCPGWARGWGASQSMRLGAGHAVSLMA